MLKCFSSFETSALHVKWPHKSLRHFVTLEWIKLFTMLCGFWIWIAWNSERFIISISGLPAGLPLDARTTVVLQVQCVVSFLYKHASVKWNPQKMQEKTWRHKIYWVEGAKGRLYEAPGREEPVSEWQVAWPRGLLMKRVCLPAYRSGHISWSDAWLTGTLGDGGLKGT